MLYIKNGKIRQGKVREQQLAIAYARESFQPSFPIPCTVERDPKVRAALA